MDILKKGDSMKVILKNKSNFNTIEIDNVTNVAFSGTTINITANGTTTAYSATSWYFTMLLM